MLREGINGFCMALADSVPGVSGGTVAFIMGFYDKFIGSIHDLVFGRREEKSMRFYIWQSWEADGWLECCLQWLCCRHCSKAIFTLLVPCFLDLFLAQYP